MTERRVLLLDTAAPEGVVAVAVGEVIVAERRLGEMRRHAEMLASAIEAVLRDAQIDRRTLGALACGRGPGSFVGVRVAMSAAKGLAFGLGIPVYGVSTLASFACDPALEDGAGAAVLDARRGELYLSRFARSEGRTTTDAPRTEQPEVLLEPGLGQVVGHLGSTGEHVVEALGGRLIARRGPSAEGMLAALGAHPGLDEAEGLVPEYARPPDAKLPSPR